MWSTRGLFVHSIALLPARNATTFTEAHAHPAVRVFVLATGLHQVAIRTGASTPRNASTMYDVDRQDEAHITSIHPPGFKSFADSLSTMATVAVSSCSAPWPEKA
jgi:hypothetical protein